MIHGIRNSFLYSSSRIINHSMCTNGEQCSCGTGFWVKNSKNEICLITNKHVLKHSEDSNKFCNFFDVHIWETSNGNTEGKPGGFSIYRFFSFTPDVPNNPLDDIVCIRWPFKAYSLSPSKSTSLKIDYFFPYSILASQNDFDNNLAVCDMLAFIGYPEPFYDTERQAPILRSGIIASDPRFNYMEKQFGNCLAYEAFSLGGSSGSPVFAIQKGFPIGPGIKAPVNFYREVKLIGINTCSRHIYSEVPTKQIPELTVPEKQHSGISLLYKSTSILEVINH